MPYYRRYRYTHIQPGWCGFFWRWLESLVFFVVAWLFDLVHPPAYIHPVAAIIGSCSVAFIYPHIYAIPYMSKPLILIHTLIYTFSAGYITSLITKDPIWIGFNSSLMLLFIGSINWRFSKNINNYTLKIWANFW
jgi:hypothetical protein